MRSTLQQAEKAIDTFRCMDAPHSSQFAAGLAHLDAFIAEHGHALVPANYQCPDGYRLGTWVTWRRGLRRAGRATPTADQIRQLDERGFDWKHDNLGVDRQRSDRAFAAGLAHLDAFIAEHGHAHVPANYRCSDGYKLGSWVLVRRLRVREGRATPTADQIHQLDERGFDWEGKHLLRESRAKRSDRAFAVGLAHLDAFIAEQGHTDVPITYIAADGFRLGGWTSDRRANRRAGRATPTPDQIRQLDERGFDWNPVNSAYAAVSERKFAVGLGYLDEFIAEHGHANVPRLSD